MCVCVCVGWMVKDFELESVAESTSEIFYFIRSLKLGIGNDKLNHG